MTSKYIFLLFTTVVCTSIHFQHHKLSRAVAVMTQLAMNRRAAACCVTASLVGVAAVGTASPDSHDAHVLIAVEPVCHGLSGALKTLLPLAS